VSGAPGTRAALERLLQAVAEAERGEAFLAAQGTAGAGWRWPGGVLVADPADPAFASVEAVPWPEGVTGAVEVTFRPGWEPTWAEVQEWFRPMEELPLLDDAPLEFTASWTRPGAPADLVLIVREPDAPDGVVPRLTIRRDPVR